MLPGIMENYHLPSSVDSLYDVTVTDHSSMVKCVLHPSLNDLIETGNVEKFDMILVKKYKMWYNESTPGGGSPYMVILEASSLSEMSVDKPENEDFVQLTPNSHLYTPILGERGYYVAEQNNDCFDGNHSSIFPESITFVTEDELEDIQWSRMRLQEVKNSFYEAEMNSVSFCKGYIIGRVIQKSEVNHHPSVSDHHKPFPMKFEIVIACGGVTMPVVIWNRCCAQYYFGISIGMIIAISNFRVHRSHISGNLEVSVNSKNPTGVLRQLPFGYSLQDPNSMVDTDRNISECRIDFRFPNLASEQAWCLSIPDDSVIDFAGEITYVGRIEREKIEGNPSRFRQYRWATLRDILNPEVELLLKIYTNGSSFSQFSELSPGDRYLFYNMTLFSICDSFYRHIILTTNSLTQLYPLTHVIAGNWSSTQSRQQIATALFNLENFTEEQKKSFTESHQRLLEICFYPATSTVYPRTTDINTVQGTAYSEFMFLQEVIDAIDNLVLGEHISCRTQGYITDIKLHSKVTCSKTGRRAIKLNIQLSNINKTHEFQVTTLIEIAEGDTYKDYIASLTSYFPSSLCIEGRSNSVFRNQSPTRGKLDIATAFHNFKHRILDKSKLENQILGLTLHAFRQSHTTTQTFLIPPHIINK